MSNPDTLPAREAFERWYATTDARWWNTSDAAFAAWQAAIAERDAEIATLRTEAAALRAALKKIAVGAPPLVNGEFGIQHTDANGKPIAWEPINPVSVVEYLVGIAVRAAGE